MARQKAYELVQRQAMRAHRGDGIFRQLLSEQTEISERLTEQELDACFDMKHHLRHVDFIYDRVFH